MGKVSVNGKAGLDCESVENLMIDLNSNRCVSYELVLRDFKGVRCGHGCN